MSAESIGQTAFLVVAWPRDAHALNCRFFSRSDADGPVNAKSHERKTTSGRPYSVFAVPKTSRRVGEEQSNMVARKGVHGARNLTSRSLAERQEAGRVLREKIPRKSHSGWKAPGHRPDPIRLLKDSDQGRIPELLPIRYGRMAGDPFKFLRGAAAIMASDLASTPVTGIRVQACGDCHIMNFGAFATPERNLIFDVNDFDETLPAPWEWDLKRLTASIEVSARTAQFKSEERERAVRAAARSYREQMARYAVMSPLEIWYQRIDLESLVKNIPQDVDRQRSRKEIDKARRKNLPLHVPLSLVKDGEKIRIRDEPLSYTINPSREPVPIATAWSMRWNAIASHSRRHTACCLTAISSRTLHLRSWESVRLAPFARRRFSRQGTATRFFSKSRRPAPRC